MKFDELKKELRVLTWNINSEKDFLRYLKNILQKENLKVIGIKANDIIKRKNCDYPFNYKRTEIKGIREYNISNKFIIEFSTIKIYVDNIAQYFDIENLKIEKIQK